MLTKSPHLSILPLYLLLPIVTNALPTLSRRQVEPVQSCANTENWVWSYSQTSPSDCTAAATQLCAMIPGEAWTVNGWTSLDSGSCRAMVYHTDQMPVPTVDECTTTLSAVISTCIVEEPNTNDGGFVNLSSDNSEIAQDGTKSVYQIGAGAYFDKIFQENDAYLAGSVMQEGGAIVHA
ncbi:hypothetical protein G7Y79_00044g080770 [Physcia stellaris]|nr:hypothetical protein G7Y79_00044g080770 [Physcia stellaris]